MIERASEADLPKILELQRMAFAEEAAFVGDPNIKPISQTLEEMREEFHKGVFLKYVKGGRILGSVRAYEEGGVCHINRLVVHPEHWSKGIGRSLMREIERIYGNAERYELFTRLDHKRTRPFYHNLGYAPFREERLSDSLSFVYLVKRNTGTDRS